MAQYQKQIKGIYIPTAGFTQKKANLSCIFVCSNEMLVKT